MIANQVLEIVLSLLVGVTSIILSLLGFVYKRYKEKCKRIDDLMNRADKIKEVSNYIMGSVDVLLEESVKIEPDIKKALKQASERYHKLDIDK